MSSPDLGLTWCFIVSGRDLRRVGICLGRTDAGVTHEPRHLYRVAGDPDEQNNLVEEHPEVAARLRQSIEAEAGPIPPFRFEPWPPLPENRQQHHMVW